MKEQLPSEIFAQIGAGSGSEVASKNGGSFRILAKEASEGKNVRPYLIQVAMDRTVEEKLLAGYRAYLWGTLAVALLASALLGYQIARRGLRPIAAITETARKIRSSNLRERIVEAGLPSEIRELAVKFNEMLDRLSDSFRRLAQFSADIAHELRTPVNNLKGEAEVALSSPRSVDEYREVLGSCLEECGRLSHMIDSLLFLARAENPQAQIARSPLDMAQELETIRDFYEAVASQSGVDLVVKSRPGIVANLDRTLLQRAVGNLISNALAHTKSGGTITLTASANNGAAIIEVSDTGTGIAAEHVPHLFDRFYRADPARRSEGGAAGLGLAIVKSIAQLHQGSATIESQVGRGTTVRLTLPAQTQS
jgi:two-component system heavy metal sensor histidine kinase CusS